MRLPTDLERDLERRLVGRGGGEGCDASEGGVRDGDREDGLGCSLREDDVLDARARLKAGKKQWPLCQRVCMPSTRTDLRYIPPQLISQGLFSLS